MLMRILVNSSPIKIPLLLGRHAGSLLLFKCRERFVFTFNLFNYALIGFGCLV